jgi:hypothetical protein
MDMSHVLVVKDAHHLDESIQLGELVQQGARDAALVGAASKPAIST